MDDDAPGWLADSVKEGQERYWSGTAWTDRVRPAGRARSLRLPEHVPQLQRALAAATADIDAVEDHLSDLFDRTGGTTATASVAPAPGPGADDDDVDLGLFDEVDEDLVEERSGPEGDDDGAFAELDAELSAEEPHDSGEVDEKVRRGLFRRRT
jgi:hypothetical protein